MKKVLCIHGIGGKDATMSKWSKDWEKTIRESSGFEEELTFHFLKIDLLFEESKERMGIQYGKAIVEFLKSWISTETQEREKVRGFLDGISWYAGMPAQFATDALLRTQLRNLMAEVIDQFAPDIIYCNSLGTLIAYDYLRMQSVAGRSFNFILITSGSQIMHPSMRQQFGGVILPLKVKYWINLHNEHDRMFANRPITISADNFASVETPFHKSFINHEATEYLGHENTINQAWPVVVRLSTSASARSFANKAMGIKTIKSAAKDRKPTRKALLIGINEYPDEANRLEGCVNDVFRISEVLQEYGFSPDEIRVALDDHATAKGIRSRLKWLLEDAKEGDLRFFFYSGHGAQIPASHADYELDENDECLVPYDFDWTIEHAYTDKEFLELYSQLSLGVNFISVFDCCHSGGITRGNGTRIKGLTPPDDIRHRDIKWNEKRQMWIPRTLELDKRKLFKADAKEKEVFTGTNGKTNRLGRAIPLWTDVKDFEKAKKEYGATGPFMPVILEACGESESAYEYRHGVASFGAFTYSLTTILREKRGNKKPITFENLMKETSKRLVELEYDQKPVLVGPKVRTGAVVPFSGNG